MKSTAKKIKVEYGSVDLPDDEFNPKHGKFRVTMYIDLDVLQTIRDKADEEGIGYQTWINRTLRQLVIGNQNIFRRVDQVEDQLKSLYKVRRRRA